MGQAAIRADPQRSSRNRQRGVVSLARAYASRMVRSAAAGFERTSAATEHIALLEELPMRTCGLGATEMRMLELVAAGHVHPHDLFPGHEKPNERRTYGYWEVGELLDGLARGPRPAVSGLVEGPFDDALHDSKDRHDRYRRSQVRRMGRAKRNPSSSLTRGRICDGFRFALPILRKLTNDRLWRWDPSERVLISP
jgi:hypothetical protein